jgi:Cysteine sulfinate desulfinase/cysteine desulfurase and related enzymes
MNEVIYLDHAAATPVSEGVIEAMKPYFVEAFYNPSSPYLPAVEVRRSYERAKDSIAKYIGAKGADLVMTAGATESINLAFTIGGKLLISETEHAAVAESAKLAGNYQMIKVNNQGIIDLDDLRNKITNETTLVSVALVNNEIGAIQPIGDIGRIIEEEKMKRLEDGNSTPIYLHSDASQGLGLLDMNVARLGVDMLTLNAGKIYGPKQVGLLWINSGVVLKTIVAGGGQERGLRSGTENVAGVIGFAEAIKEIERHREGEKKRLGSLKSALRCKLEAGILDVKFLGNEKRQLTSFLPISIPGIDAERLIFMLENKGVLVSTGAACSANKGLRSKALKAIGLSDEEIDGSLRITLGRLNNEENIERAGELIIDAVNTEKKRINSV